MWLSDFKYHADTALSLDEENLQTHAITYHLGEKKNKNKVITFLRGMQKSHMH